ncbi:N-6 DNA methylase [Streptosporangium pseudovulgare]|uniref:Type II restriction endonuclease subunit M n=1 Tax=Streptosporangium pseudovulgare TaxID=35765 RepID=A0ABQ2QZ87_9ACTN|nr:N-6 DNA methylase [Streptosporangium pseudovulgare]GGQ00500.1 type II restriction endonuclease subunit M [Streptosporangium pseudovulgare]
MGDSATVAAADIARLAGVGRAAVSNWRRRFDDFPVPVGGTSSSPLFSLTEVEEWLRRQGKLAEVPLGERVWQELRAGVEDLRLAEAVGQVGAFLLFLDRSPKTWAKLARKDDDALSAPLAAELAMDDLPGPTGASPGRPPAAGSALDDRPERGEAAGPSTVSVPLLRSVAELAAERGAAATFDFLCERYLDAHSRRVVTLSPDVADLMTTLSAAGDGVVLDPLCGLGTLLLSAAASGATALSGQERDEHAARIAAVRLLLHGHPATVRVGDALRDDRFASLQADAVVCGPPFAERAWGYEELAGDVRWQYGLPPRGEPELPWVQHALFHLRPGGHAVVLMPSAAADRRSGRRIRAQLLRAGALRAVVALPAGTAPNALGSPHLWVLRKPEHGDPIPSHVLMIDAADLPWPRVRETVLDGWRSFTVVPGGAANAQGGAGLRGTAETQVGVDTPGAVPLIELLDEDVDLTPARHVTGRSAAGTGQEFTASLDALAASAAALQRAVEELRTLTASADELPRTTVAEQVRAGTIVVFQAPRGEPGAGAVTVQQASPGEPDAGTTPMLTVEDVIAGRPPTGRAEPAPGSVASTSGSSAPSAPGSVILEPGDVVVPAGSRSFAARVVTEGGALLGPGLYLLRPDPERVDPDCLAGFLRIAGSQTSRRGQTGSSRSDIRRVELPRLPLAEQRRLGDAFRRLAAVEAATSGLAERGSTLVRLGIQGLGDGTLRG